MVFSPMPRTRAMRSAGRARPGGGGPRSARACSRSVLHARQLDRVVHHLLLGLLLHRRDARRVEAGDLREDLRGGLGHVPGLAEAVGVERLHQHLVDARQRAERPVGELAHLPHAGLAVDVQLPAGELGRQPHVLPAPADGQRQLVVRDDELHRVVGLVDDDAG